MKTLESLLRNPNITVKEIKQFVSTLPSGIQSFNPDQEIAVLWSILDVQHEAKDRDLELTDKEAKDLLDDMSSNHDATIGINWDVINTYLDFFC